MCTVVLRSYVTLSGISITRAPSFFVQTFNKAFWFLSETSIFKLPQNCSVDSRRNVVSPDQVALDDEWGSTSFVVAAEEFTVEAKTDREQL